MCDSVMHTWWLTLYVCVHDCVCVHLCMLSVCVCVCVCVCIFLSPSPSLSHTRPLLSHRELLAEIAQFEKAELGSSSQKETAPSHKRTQLEPLNYAAGEKLLHMVSCGTLQLP